MASKSPPLVFSDSSCSSSYNKARKRARKAATSDDSLTLEVTHPVSLLTSLRTPPVTTTSSATSGSPFKEPLSLSYLTLATGLAASPDQIATVSPVVNPLLAAPFPQKEKRRLSSSVTFDFPVPLPAFSLQASLENSLRRSTASELLSLGSLSSRAKNEDPAPTTAATTSAERYLVTSDYESWSGDFTWTPTTIITNSSGGEDFSALSPEERKRVERKVKNKIAARKCRAKKQQEIDGLGSHLRVQIEEMQRLYFERAEAISIIRQVMDLDAINLLLGHAGDTEPVKAETVEKLGRKIQDFNTRASAEIQERQQNLIQHAQTLQALQSQMIFPLPRQGDDDGHSSGEERSTEASETSPVTSKEPGPGGPRGPGGPGGPGGQLGLLS